MCHKLVLALLLALLSIGCGKTPEPSLTPPAIEFVSKANAKESSSKPAKQALTNDQILNMLSKFEPSPGWKDDFISADERTIKFLEQLAGDPTTTPHHVAGIFGGAHYIEDGPKRFIPFAIQRVADHDRLARSSAFGFLCDQNIDHSICSILATGLYDENDMSMFWSAGLGLVKHGGENEVVVFETWLRQHGDRPEMKKRFEFVEKCRNDLYERLQKEKSEK